MRSATLIDSSRRGDWAAVVFALILPTLVTLTYFVWAERFAASVQQTTYAIAKTVQFGFPLVWFCWVRRQRPQPWPITSRGIGIGVMFGLLVACTMLLLYHGWLKTTDLFAHAEGEMRQKVIGMELGQPEKFIALGVFYSLFHSLLEEYYWRWFVFGQLQSLVRYWPAVLISSLGFMAHHVVVLGTYFGFASLETWLFSFSVAIGGAFWAWLYHRSGSLVGPWLSHLLVDAAIFVAGYDIVRGLVEG